MLGFLIVVGIVMICGPLFAPSLGTATKLLLMSAGAVAVAASFVLLVISRLYHKTAANEAIVRTGLGGLKVVIDGGCIVMPVVHRFVPVSLRTMKLTCKREGPDALVTQDKLRVDVHSEFFMRVGADEQNVLNAARAFGEYAGDEAKVEDIVGRTLRRSLRSVAATYDCSELLADRQRFAQMVHEMVAKEIHPNGLVLETVTISRLARTDSSPANDSSTVS